MSKDLTYAIEEARRAGIPLSTASAALGVFRNACAKGHAEEDIAAIVEPLRPAK